MGMAVAANAQLTVDPTLTPEDLVQNVLLGGGVTVSNVTFNGQPGNIVDPNAQIGSFDASMANVGVTNGVVISTGDIGVCVGPNDQSDATVPQGGLNTPGDPDLAQLINFPLIDMFDAAVLEFDFVPAGDSINFNFVFGSEEYLEFVNLGFNDPFAFFISGPGFSGPFLNGAENIALVPMTTTPVSIDNVNDLVNSQYYVDNGDGFTAPFNNDPLYVQLDGLTTVLAARAQVQCGQSYHIKLAVSDAGDGSFDSAVFLQEGSFSSASLVTVNVNTVAGNGTMTEGCTDGELIISRPDTMGDLVVNLSLGGTATNGIDYTQIPTPIIIPSGSSSVVFPISAFQDGTVDSPEDIIFTTWFINACGDTTFSTATVTILEYDPIQLMADADQFLDCTQDSVPLNSTATGGFQNLYYQWSTGDTVPSTWVPGMSNGTYSITVSDDCNMSTSVNITVNAGCEITIPNVFTPNSDGFNDTFFIDGITGTRNTVKIWNRWGNLIFDAVNYKNNWRAEGVADGTYFYEVIVVGQNLPYTGHLTILNSR